MLRRTLALALALGTVLAVGCGGKLATAEGSVTLDGKALAGATVTFVPAGKGEQATGVTNDAGNFTLSTRGKPGAFPGEYTVTVLKSAGDKAGDMKPGSPEYLKYMADKAKGGGQPTESPEAKALAKANKTPVKVTVVAGTPIKVELKSQ